jgi:hypothetical protein
MNKLYKKLNELNEDAIQKLDIDVDYLQSTNYNIKKNMKPKQMIH